MSLEPVVLTGRGLTLADLARVARDPRVTLTLAPEAQERVVRGRGVIERIATTYREGFERHRRGETPDPPAQDYGVTTGFGEFKDLPVAPADLERLQVNLLRSHSVGVGEGIHREDPGVYFPGEVVRAALVIRLNAFLKGHSGVRPELVDVLLALIHRGIVPLVPQKGSLGSSGDLCPLSHLFGVLVGEGHYYRVRTPAELELEHLTPAHWRPATELAADLGREIPALSFKEGLALINGATVSAAALALAVADAEGLAEAADAAGALSLEAVCGCARAFDPKVHAARGLPGQIASAAHYRRLLTGSRLLERAGAVQDAYSLRCAPAVHGAARDAINYARSVVEAEINAATDNPLFFPGPAGEPHGEEPWDFSFAANWPEGYRGRERASYSAGNFHGEPVAMAADFLTIAVAELANISERRTQLLLDQHHNRGLPPNLTVMPGVNSGLMIAQYSAASLVAENKILAHPSVVDSIPTAANIEDHVAMATTAARKARTVVAHTQAVLAIELLVASQAIDWRAGLGRPSRPVAAAPGADRWAAAEQEAAAFTAATAPAARPRIAEQLGVGTRQVYLAVRELVPPVITDRPLADDVARLRRWLGEGAVRDLER